MKKADINQFIISTGMAILIWIALSLALLSVVDYIYFTYVQPDFEFMDPESNAVFFSQRKGYLLSVNAVTFIAMYFAGYTVAVLGPKNLFIRAFAVIIGMLVALYLALPHGELLSLYPKWHMYSPFLMAFIMVGVGVATCKSDNKHNA